jgi:hypothetical protein
VNGFLHQRSGWPDSTLERLSLAALSGVPVLRQPEYLHACRFIPPCIPKRLY